MKVRWLAMALAAGFLAACQTSTNPQPSPTPVARESPTPTISGPIGVYDGPSLDGKSHVVYLVAVGDYGAAACQPDCSFAATETAKVLATTKAANRANVPPLKCYGCQAPALPSVSASRDKVYFLDGDSRVRAMTADGHLSDVTTITGNTSTEVVFAVSPDDKRIAVSLVDWGNHDATVYVSELNGGGRTDLFTSPSTTGYYWPVGWHGDSVLLAGGDPVTGAPNQYDATVYGLIDPVAGAQLKRLGSGDCVPTGAITPAGFACVASPGSKCVGPAVATSGSSTFYSSCLRRVDWTGKETTFLVSAYGGINDLVVHHAALSPDGAVIATDGLFWVGAPNAAGFPGVVNGFTTSVPFNTMPAQPGIGFLDPTHVSFMFVNSQTGLSYQRMYSFQNGYAAFKNVYFQGEASNSFVPGGSVVGQLMGTLPGGL